MNCRLLPIALLAVSAVQAEVKLPAVISDHMVLQRDVAAPIWGTAVVGEEVSVSIAGQTKSTKADANGKWMVKLDPLAVAEGLSLTVKGTNTIEVKDVMVGEVWLGSGQSNMAGPVRTYKVNDAVLKKQQEAAPYPKVRLKNAGNAGWVVATPQNVDGFSALLFAYGLRLQEELQVPVGLMLGAVGGTPSGFWLTEKMYRADAACAVQAKEFAQTYDHEAAMKAYEKALVAWQEIEARAKKENVKPQGRAPIKPALPGECHDRIGYLYERYIQPYVPYTIRGVLWDQGEGGTAINGVDQYHVMGALIKGWRGDFGQDFPFLYVQKVSGGGTAWDMKDPVTMNASPFAPQPAQVTRGIDGLHREVHIKIHEYPKTAMVISTDLGGMTHPTNKSGYGARAARVALGFVYDRPIEYSGPLYSKHSIDGGKVRIKFTHVGQGLAARHSDKLQGFMIAGANKQFHWADAVIEGDSVIVSSPAVPAPQSVRYAWSSVAPWANLFNKDGLPAQTFRTDDWK